MTIMGDIAVSPVLPKLYEAFETVPNAELLVKLVMTTPAIFIALLAPFAGKLMDTIGRKKVLVSCMALYIVGGAAPLFLDSLYTILASRSVVGIGVAGIITAVNTIIGDRYTGSKLNTVMGLQSTFVGLCGVLYLFVAGQLANITWQLPFLIYLIPILFLIGVFYLVDEPKHLPQNDIDITKAVTIPNKTKWTILGVYSIAFIAMVFFFLLSTQGPFFLKQLGEIQNSDIGNVTALMTLCSSIAALFYNKLKTALSFHKIYFITFGLMGIGFASLFLANSFYTSLWAYVLTGISIGIILPNTAVWLLTIIPSHVRGFAMGGLITSYFGGQFCSPVIAHPFVSVLGYNAAFLLAGSLLVLMSVGFLLPKDGKTSLPIAE